MTSNQQRMSNALARRLARLTLAGFACMALLAATGSRAETVRLGGTGSGLGVARLLGQAYAKTLPGFELHVVPSLGSAGGIKAVAQGATQIAVISRPLKAEEAAAGLRAFEIGRTAFVLATTKEGVNQLSLDRIADLYAGRLSAWSDGQPVRLVLRPAGDADTALLAAFSPAVKESLAAAMAREGMVTALTDQDSADEIERLPGGLGTASMALLISEGRRARPLAIDGVAPTLANVAGGRYRHVKPLLLVVRPGAQAGVLQFIAFAGSDAGRRVLAAAGVDVSTSNAASAAPR